MILFEIINLQQMREHLCVDIFYLWKCICVCCSLDFVLGYFFKPSLIYTIGIELMKQLELTDALLLHFLYHKASYSIT